MRSVACYHSSPVGEDTKPYERSELGEVGEGLWTIDSAEPLTNYS